jgi:5'-nucleotidase / UDP-sugar diphosphatase
MKEEETDLQGFRFPAFFSFLLVGALLGVFLAASSARAFAAPVAKAADLRVTILHTNDMHSHMLGFGPNSEYTPLTTLDDGTVGGMARVAGKVNEIRAARGAEGVPVLLVDAGDFTMGTGFTLLRGEAELRVMDALGYDVITLGNHEFDWKPAGTAEILSHIPDLSLDLPVVASNLVFDLSHPDDDALEALFTAGVVRSYHVQTLENGLRVGFFGLVGEDAASVAPFAYPVKFLDVVPAAQAMVAALQGEGVDLIVCLSHSGLDEDAALAEAVPGIDVIVSGHTHESTGSPRVVGSTVIVQAGSYTEELGVLDLDLSGAPTPLVGYELAAIDDTVPGDAAMQDLVEGLMAELDADVLNPMGYGFRNATAETSFDLIATAGQESNLGNLITDSMRWMVDRVEYDPMNPQTRVDVAIESNGVIRDDILAGATGRVDFSDAFRALPLGFGLDGAVGYPMLTIYVTAEEVRKAMEVITTVYPLKGSDYWLNISGMRLEYLPTGIPFLRVKNIFLGNDVDGYSDVPLDTSPSNTELYKVAINYYVAQFIAVIGEYTYGILTIDPKDALGVSYLDPVAHPDGLDEARVDTDPVMPGVQELQQWRGFMDYLGTFPDLEPNGIPNVPDRYAGPTGRIQPVTCFIATAAFGTGFQGKIDVLRSFRDSVLLQHPAGRSFVNAYYTYGPPVAEAVAERPWLKGWVRFFLLPVIGIASLFV